MGTPMYSLVIVEDEPIERQALALMIQNNCANIHVLKQVDNGFDAIEECRKQAPDMMMVDINMPGIDGLETIKEIQKFAPQVHFLILSSYNRFEYAQQALKLGVEDFILKPAKIAKLKQAFECIAEKMNNQNQIETQNTTLIDRMELIRPVVESDCIYAVVTDDRPDELERLFSFLGYAGNSGFCFIVNADMKYRYLLNRIKTSLLEVGTCVIGEFFNDMLIFCVLYEQPPNEKRTFEVGNFVSMLLKENGRSECKLGIGDVVESVTRMNESYRQAAVALDYAKSNQVKFLKYEEIIGNGGMDVKNNLPLYAARLGRQMLTEKWESCQNQLDKIVLDLTCANGFAEARELAYKFLVLTEQELKKAMPALKPHLSADAVSSSLFHVANAKQLGVYLMNRMKSMDDVIKGFKSANTNALVTSALDYIERCYCENISLDDIAQELGISSFYLSKLLKKHTGKNCTDLIAEKRMEQAKLLLHQNLSIKEVTYSVGFISQNYFTKIFKKQVGITPSEYKNSLEQEKTK